MPKNKPSSNDAFPGFTREAVAFLAGLGANNDKTWFDAHRDDYERFVLEPMRLLVAALAPTALEVDPQVETEPRVDRTISRLRRDTRFSKDKSPYRTNVWLTFKRREPDWAEAPAYYFELSEDGYRFGMGYYSASPDTMRRFRENLDEKPKAFLDVVRPIGSEFNVEGEAYKRPFPGTRDPCLDAYYRRKSFYLACNHKLDDTLFSPRLAHVIAKGFASIGPLYQYLMELKDQQES
jgi:uncharacterized protein (TIGR02453 family)